MSLNTATHFWIEAGGMSGDPNHRHQIEFSNDLVQFFDQNALATEIVTIRLPDGSPHVRPLTYRGTDYGQWTEQWRLGLPTVNMGGPPYAGRVLKFERITAGGNVIYALEVADAGSATANAWRAQAAAAGQVAQTGGPQGREFGYW